ITMSLFITGVGTLIHLYSIGYMHGDPNFSKFFVYMNLFAAAMLILVLGDNMLMTFLGWEGVGACSYFLISFWFTDPANASAGKKAFVTNRVGDFGFMLAMFLVFATIGSIDYANILFEAPGFSTGTATAVVLLLLVAAAGKSAQLPLYVWLPDAMAGPTPVSALIHAATMVTSGVYLLTRMNPVLAAADGWAVDLVAWVGALTALFAATVALAQNDIKKVLAYSTVSQLGYLFLAVGVGAYVPAIFHMVTHAFFKALLFLGSGSVIHGLHDEQDMRRMGGLARLMPITAFTFIVGWLAIAGVPPFAGFWSKDEILVYAWNDNKALWAIGLVTAVLTAFYMTRQVILTFFGRTRFYDAMTQEIEAAFDSRLLTAESTTDEAQAALATAHAAVEKAAGDVEKRTAAAEAAATKLNDAKEALALVSPEDEGHEKLAKAMAKAEKGVPKASENLVKAQATVADANAGVDTASEQLAAAKASYRALAATRSELPVPETHVTAVSAAPELGEFEDEMPDSYRSRQEYHPHESPWTMTAPLVALAGAATVAGGLNLPFSKDLHFLEHWLETSLFGNEAKLLVGTSTKWGLAIVAVVCALVAIYAAFMVYLRNKVDPRKIERPLFARAWYVDETYARIAGGPGYEGFDQAAEFDRKVIDGIVNGIANGVRSAGQAMRGLQTGYVRNSALGIVIGSVGVVLWFLSRLWQS
ncbi:MAG: NADH-quinone oxidoreductase subunit L, partial [Acidimicrobiia bacterium]|nr:NADH-quinone oxidoreductase subunit L [Acidimicrobiia bacterium]